MRDLRGGWSADRGGPRERAASCDFPRRRRILSEDSSSFVTVSGPPTPPHRCPSCLQPNRRPSATSWERRRRPSNLNPRVPPPGPSPRKGRRGSCESPARRLRGPPRESVPSSPRSGSSAPQIPQSPFGRPFWRRESSKTSMTKSWSSFWHGGSRWLRRSVKRGRALGSRGGAVASPDVSICDIHVCRSPTLRVLPPPPHSRKSAQPRPFIAPNLGWHSRCTKGGRLAGRSCTARKAEDQGRCVVDTSETGKWRTTGGQVLPIDGPGILIADGRGPSEETRAPRISAFIWAERESPAPTLPYGRWKRAV